MSSKTYQRQLDERLDKNEIIQLKTKVQLEQESLRFLQNDIAAAIAQHLDETGMGFNDLTRALGTSPSQTVKILKGKANLTCASIAHIAAFLGKKARLILS